MLESANNIVRNLTLVDSHAWSERCIGSVAVKAQVLIVKSNLRVTRGVVPPFAPLLAVFICLAGLAYGSAFSITELGARSGGMATAFTSIADDGSALFYNPAGIAFQDGTQFQFDTLVVVGLFRFNPSSTPPGTVVPPNGYSGAIKPHFIPVSSMFFTKRIRPKWTIGFGAFAPFGLSDNFTNFNDSDPAVTKFPGRFAGTRGRLEEIWFQPTVAYRLNPNSSLAIGVAYVHSHLLLEQSFLNPLTDGLDFGRETAAQIFPGVDTEQAARSIARLLPEGRSRVAGTANSPGFNVGYLYKHQRTHTNVGLMFRSAVVNHLHGLASFAFTSPYPLQSFVAADLLPKAFPTQKTTGTFTTPATYAVGVSNSSFWHTLFAVDFRFQDYQRFSSVPLNFSQTEAINPDVRTPAEKRLFFDFRNSYQIATGMERSLNEKTIIRAGYMFDRSPVVDKSVGPIFPDANRHTFSVGATRIRGDMELTLFYQAVKFVDRTTDVAANADQFTNGLYHNFAHLAGLGIRMHKRERDSSKP